MYIHTKTATYDTYYLLECPFTISRQHLTILTSLKRVIFESDEEVEEVEEEGSNNRPLLLSGLTAQQIQCTMHRADDSTIADNNDTTNDNGDNGFEPTTAERVNRKKKGRIKNAHKRKGRMQGTNAYKRRVPTPDWKRKKMAVQE